MFLLGLHADSGAMNMGPNGPRSIALGSEAALCLVDIDKPDIQLPEELPIFPHRTPFIEELNHVLDKHQVKRIFLQQASKELGSDIHTF